MSFILDVWYVVMKAGDFHMLHSHKESKMAGAIYLEVPDNLPDPQGNINWLIGGSQQPLYEIMYTNIHQNRAMYFYGQDGLRIQYIPLEVNKNV